MPVTSEIISAFGGLFSNPTKTGAARPAAPPSRVKRSGSTEAAKAAAESDSIVFGGGLAIEAIGGAVVESLERSIRSALGTLAGLGVADRYGDALAPALGQPGATGTIAHSLSTLAQAFSDLERDPGAGASAVQGAAERLADQFRALSAHIQSLRARADRDLAQSIAKASAILGRLAQVNDRVAVTTVTGRLAAQMVQERRALVEELARYLDFNMCQRADNSLALFAQGGTPLLGTQARFHFTAFAGEMTAACSRATGELSGLGVNGADIADKIATGDIPALFILRDKALPDLQTQIDTLAQTMQARLNQVSNRALGAGAARQHYAASRPFADPGAARLSLAGGDTLLHLLGENGEIVAGTSVGPLMKRYRGRAGLPSAASWPLGQFADALDGWIRQSVGEGGEARLDERGRLVVESSDGHRLRWQDRGAVSLLSSLALPPDQPLGLSGPLHFSDSTGHLYAAEGPLALRAEDGLAAIAAKLAAVPGLAAELVEQDGGRVALRVATRQGPDLVAEADPAGTAAQARLGFLAGGNAEDVAVSLAGRDGMTMLTSRPLPADGRALGLCGVLALLDQEGSPRALPLAPDWTAGDLIGAVSAMALGTTVMTAQMPAGNRLALRIAVQAPAKLRLQARPGAYCTEPLAEFKAAGGGLRIGRPGRPALEAVIPAKAGPEEIAAILGAPAMAEAGILAELRQVDGLAWLEIADKDALPLAFSGPAAGPGPGRLDLFLNPADALGLAPPARQIVPGFANFLGMNDLYVPNPADAFDAKAATGVFTSTASPGTAGAIAANPALAEDPQALADPDIASGAVALLANPQSIAAAGGLPRAQQSLPGYAAAIVESAVRQRHLTKARIVYQRTLLDSLTTRREGVARLDFDTEVQTLNSYRQILLDSSRVLSATGLLVTSLAVA